jgi:catechol-2,3-dioxygenase
MTNPVPAVSFSHLGIYVYDLAKMEDFYTRVLGFIATDRGIVRGTTPIVFLSRNPEEHHQIVLAGGRTGAPTDRLVNQISLRVESLAALRRIHELASREPEVTDIDPVNHCVTWSVYFRDPEGNRIEAFVDSPWYVRQPLVEKLDLSLSDEEIAARTKARWEADPTFKPLAQWKREFADKLKAQMAGTAA